VEFGDIVKGLPISDSSCAAVYCSHVLEHLALEDFRGALNNTFRLLIVGGVFRLVMPDFQACIDAYNADQTQMRACNFMRYSGLGLEARPRSWSEIARSFWGNSRHLWIWDYGGAKIELEKAGFRNIRRAQYGDSPDPMFAKVEEEDRWFRCLGIECVR
jgi:ubiquinone/menaquinone biosynthesis C-methylase UbiE